MQKTILRNLLYNKDYFSKVFPYLKKEHFDVETQSKIFEKMHEHFFEYDTPPTTKEIALKIKNDAILSSEQKSETIDELKSTVSSEEIENETFVMNETEKFIKRREMVDAIYKSATIIEKDEPFENVLGFIQKALEISFNYDTGMDYKDSTLDRFEYYHQKIKGITCGIPSIDEALDGGFRDKTLSIIAGPSHSGKSAMLVACAAQAAINNKNVLFLTLEMSEMEIAKRVDSNLMDYPANDFSKMSKTEYIKKFSEIEDYVGKLKIKEFPAGYMDTLKLQALMNDLEMEDGFKPDIVFVDYLTLMSSSRITLSAAGGMYSYYKYIAEELHGFSKQNDLPVVSATQLNRTAFGNLEADASSISDSMGIFMTADNVLALLSTEEMVNDNKIMGKWLKNRNSGYLGNNIIGVDFSKMKFFDIVDEFNQTQNNIENSPLIGNDIILGNTNMNMDSDPFGFG